MDGGGNNSTLSTDTTVTQSAAITNTNTLTLLSNGGGGAFTLNTQNNAVTTLDGDTDTLGAVSFRDDNGFDVAGLNAGTSTVALTVASTGTITQSAGISAGLLDLNGAGTYTLGTSNNAVTTLDVAGGLGGSV